MQCEEFHFFELNIECEFLYMAIMFLFCLLQRSDSVTLDLLTYGDLEALRSRKGSVSHPRTTPTVRSSAALGSKRYLILTYTVEFDRIHYPLPLSYAGKPDPRLLQDTVRQLQQEIKQLQSNVSLQIII